METRIISVEIPSSIKSSLSRMCYGLPDVTWYEPTEFYLPISSIQFQDPSFDLDIVEELKTVKLPLSTLTISGMKPQLSKGGKGQILFLIKEKDALEKAKKVLEKPLKKFPIKLVNNSENLSIPVGNFNKSVPSKIANWMETNAFFAELSFYPENFFYLKPQTLKNRFFYPIAKFPLPE